MPGIPTINQLSEQLIEGKITSLALTDRCIAQIEDVDGEGHLAFTKVDAEQARQAARASDQLREAGIVLSPIMGLPVSVKDLFDVAGQITRAGSKLLNKAMPATEDAAVVALLRKAGAIIIGRTNMTEFAYSGLGLNPHYGTPASPYDRQTRRIPGGSSSGAGVSVADQMAVFGMGTDTGGSVRIPAALCGITGFKPTARRVSTQGVLPLSTTYDSIGPLAPSVACCITVDQIISNQRVRPLTPITLKGLRLAVPQGIAMRDLDNHVAADFDNARSVLEKAGVSISEVTFDSIEQSNRPSKGGRLLAAEAFAWHRAHLEDSTSFALYDPRVSTRMMPAAQTSAADYIDLLHWRATFLQQVNQELADYDALLLPTTPTIAPPIAALEESDEAYFASNVMMLRNTSIINQIDGCALSIPSHQPGAPATGIMIAGTAMQDEKVLRIGLAVEAVLHPEKA